MRSHLPHARSVSAHYECYGKSHYRVQKFVDDALLHPKGHVSHVPRKSQATIVRIFTDALAFRYFCSLNSALFCVHAPANVSLASLSNLLFSVFLLLFLFVCRNRRRMRMSRAPLRLRLWPVVARPLCVSFSLSPSSLFVFFVASRVVCEFSVWAVLLTHRQTFKSSRNLLAPFDTNDKLTVGTVQPEVKHVSRRLNAGEYVNPTVRFAVCHLKQLDSP